tara:strand:+ start:1090 stop:2262 length:1173 start_codon:yes stop_codon:yes gene_type:complete
MKICVAGAGYVGFSLSVLLSQRHKVISYDTSKQIVQIINNSKSPIKDKLIGEYLKKFKLNLEASICKSYSFKDAKYIIICTPTNYNSVTGSFDTSTVEKIISDAIKFGNDPTIVIKSTVPLGFTEKMKKKNKYQNIFFSPEFLRESNCLYDNLYPSRIIVGSQSNEAHKFAKILFSCSKKKSSELEIIKMNSSEAEAVKLFSNTYLAMRISFFNELDAYCETNDLLTSDVIKGVSQDSRIGNYYNNPSFGYGGYCLPKDTKQLLANFKSVPNNIIKSVVAANKTRKNFVINAIINKKPKNVGIYRLIMKSDSDNFRDSAILDIIKGLKKNNINIILYEPLLDMKKYKNVPLIKNLETFISMSDLIVANRITDDISHVSEKIYSRDIFQEN